MDHLFLNRGAITSFATGTGKTITAIASAACLRSISLLFGRHIDVVFVTPASLVDNMKNAIKQYPYDFGKSYRVVSSNIFRDAMLYHKMMEGPEYLRDAKFLETKKKYSDLICGENTFLIVDEAHEMKTDYDFTFAKEPERGKPDVEDVKSRAKMFLEECTPKVWRILLMTATPMMNRWYDIMNLIAATKNVPQKSLKGAIRERTYPEILLYHPELVKYLPVISIDLWKAMGGKDATFKEGTHLTWEDYPVAVSPKALDNVIMFKDVDYSTGDFPSRTDRYFGAKMSREYYQEYARMENAMRRKTKKRKTDNEDMEGLMTVLQKAIASIPNNPKDAVMRRVIESQQHDKISVYSRFLIPLRELKKKMDAVSTPLGYTSFIITGSDVPPHKRDAYLKQINSTKKAIIYLSDAGGQGLDFKEITYAIVYEPSVNDSREEQFIGRAVRYRSHSHLPPEKRHVTVLRLYLCVPDDVVQSSSVRRGTAPANGRKKKMDDVMPDQWIIGNNAAKSFQTQFFRRQLETIQL